MKEAEKIMIIENEMKKFSGYLTTASRKVRASNISEYPIFVMHKQEVALGISILDRNKAQTNWSINVSSLEEFVKKNLIYERKVNEFKASYKHPDTHICLFVLSDLGAQFMYIPTLDSAPQ